MLRLKIDKILIEQNKTPYWLSKQTGISPNNIGRICNKRTNEIRFDTIEKLCKALNCSINDLFETDDPQLNILITYSQHDKRTT